MSWKNVALGELCEVLDSKRKPITKKDRTTGSYPYYGATGIVDYVGDFIFNEKLVLIGEDGAKWDSGDMTAFIADGEYWVNNHAHVIKPFRNRLLDEWLVYYFYYKDLKEFVTGLTVPKLNQGQLKTIPIPLPPLATQQKIVAKLDAIFAKIDTATAAAEANANNAESLFQSYLNEIFERGGEGWEVKKLKDITEKIGSGATPRGGNESYKASGISLIRSMNVYDEGFYYPKLAFIDEAQAKELDNVKVENEDVLLNITGASVARCCVVPEDVLPARVNQHVSILRANKNIIIPKLIHYILISPVHKNKLLSVGEDGGATRQALTKAQLLEYEINFPSDLSSQLKLVEKISNFYSYTFSIKNNYEEKIRTFPLLKQSILIKAFSGELVKD